MSKDLHDVLKKIEDADLVTFMDQSLSGPNVRGMSFGETPLHIVAVWGDVESARILLEAGAEIDVPGEHSYTPLHEAIAQGHEELVALLLERGADPYRITEMGNGFDLAQEDPKILEVLARFINKQSEQGAVGNEGHHGPD
jgi:uncharacterized protein